MKHILIIETDIPDPEFSVIARTKDTLDGFEAVEHREEILPSVNEMIMYFDDDIPDDCYIPDALTGANWIIKKLGL